MIAVQKSIRYRGGFQPPFWPGTWWHGLTVGIPTSVSFVYKADSGTDDDGELFQAYVKSRAMPPGGDIGHLGEVAQVGQPILVARAGTATALMLTVDRDFGLETQTSLVDLTAAGTETRVFRKFEGAATGDATVVQLQVGDPSAVASDWSLDVLYVQATTEGDR